MSSSPVPTKDENPKRPLDSAGTSIPEKPPKRVRKRKSLWHDCPAEPATAPAPTPAPVAPFTQMNLSAAEKLLPMEVQQRLSAMHSVTPSIPTVPVVPIVPVLPILPPTHFVSNIANRIYVGNLSYDITQQYIMSLFSQFGRIVSVAMPREGSRSKGFCFVEFDNATSAQTAMASMQGFLLSGRPIKVGPPSQMGQGSVSQSIPLSQLGLPQGVVPGAPTTRALGPASNRIYVGSIAFQLQREHVQQVFEAFGRILTCDLIPSTHDAGSHKGYGFIEYDNAESARAAIKQMNGFALMGRNLKVGPSLHGTPAGPTLSVPPVATPVPPLAAPAQEESLEREENITISSSDRARLMTKSLMLCANRCVVLQNMLGPEDAVDNDLEEETRMECSRFGEVEKLKIVEKKSATMPQERVQVYVLYKTVEAARKACDSLNGRRFGGRQVSVRPHENLEVFEDK